MYCWFPYNPLSYSFVFTLISQVVSIHKSLPRCCMLREFLVSFIFTMFPIHFNLLDLITLTSFVNSTKYIYCYELSSILYWFSLITPTLKSSRWNNNFKTLWMQLTLEVLTSLEASCIQDIARSINWCFTLSTTRFHWRCKLSLLAPGLFQM